MGRETRRPAPSEYDRWTFRAIPTTLRGLPPKPRYGKARDALYREKLLPTKAAFTTYAQRDQRPNVRVEMQVPLAWWDSSVGINEHVLKTVFTGFDTASVSLARWPTPFPPLAETTTGGLEKMHQPREATSKASNAVTVNRHEGAMRARP